MHRDADHYYTYASDAVSLAGLGSSTVVIAPFFSDESFTFADWSGEDAQKQQSVVTDRPVQQPVATQKVAMWSKSTHQWIDGEESDANSGVSSFHALDLVVDWAHAMFPSLEMIIAIGWSSGAQQYLRWSVFTQQGADGETTPSSSSPFGRRLVASGRKPMRFLFGDPSALIYFNDQRPDKSCMSATPECGIFGAPFKTCHGKWDYYEYGLSDVTVDSTDEAARSVANYVAPFAASNAEVKEKLPERWLTKDVRFVLGELDTKPCEDGSCSDKCGADLQGDHRLQRAHNFIQHVFRLPGGKLLPHGYFNGGHSATMFFQSRDFREYAFEGLDTAPYCFPGEALVEVSAGRRLPLAELRVGDGVLVQREDESLGYERVLSFLHETRGGHYRFRTLIHERGSFSASGSHMVFTALGGVGSGSRSDKLVSHVQVGDFLLVEEGTGHRTVVKSRVLAVKVTTGDYAGAPLTAAGTLVVDGVVASAYAAPAGAAYLPHAAVHAFLFPVRVWHAVGLPVAVQVGEASTRKTAEDVYHPYISFFYKTLGISRLIT